MASPHGNQSSSNNIQRHEQDPRICALRKRFSKQFSLFISNIITSATTKKKTPSSPREFTLDLYPVCVLFVQPGITLLLINLSGNTTAQVSVTVTTQGAVAAHKHGARKHVGGRKFRHVHDPSFTGVDEAAGAVRDEYHLTPKDGNLRSQVMLLNGRALATDAAGNIPTLEAVKVDAAQPIAVAPYSIMFARISHFNAPACS